MSKFKQYKRKIIAELRKVTEEEANRSGVISNVSISNEDLNNGSPKIGDMIARNPKNHNQQWLVEKQYFEDNFEGTNTVKREAIEEQIQVKNLNESRLTSESINEQYKYCEYWVVPNTTTTVCAMILQNNFVVVGTSACVSIANFDKVLGEQIAYENARDKIWELEGYLLKQKQYEKGK